MDKCEWCCCSEYRQRQCCDEGMCHSRRQTDDSSWRLASMNRNSAGHQMDTDRFPRCQWSSDRQRLSPVWASLTEWMCWLSTWHSWSSTGTADPLLNSPDCWTCCTMWRDPRTHNLQQHSRHITFTAKTNIQLKVGYQPWLVDWNLNLLVLSKNFKHSYW